MYDLIIKASDFWMRKLWTECRHGFASKEQAKRQASLRLSEGLSEDYLYFTDGADDSCSAVLEMGEASYRISIRPKRPSAKRRYPRTAASGLERLAIRLGEPSDASRVKSTQRSTLRGG